jgi:hypothetical protein
MLTLSQWAISVFGVASFLLILREERRHQIAGTICGLLSNPFWWIVLISTEQWGTLPVHACYTAGWIWKAWQLRKVSLDESAGQLVGESMQLLSGRQRE